MRISIDGNIGSGKSTVLGLLKEKLNDKFKIIDENIQDWEQYLREYYKDIKKNSLLFQMKVLHHHLGNKANDNENCIHERSPLSCINIFGQNLRNKSFLGNLDMLIMNSYNDSFGWIPDIIIYIRTDPEIAKKRVDKRSRQGETIPLNYLKEIHNLYEKEYILEKKSKPEIFIVDGNKNIEEVFIRVSNIISAF